MIDGVVDMSVVASVMQDAARWVKRRSCGVGREGGEKRVSSGTRPANTS